MCSKSKAAISVPDFQVEIADRIRELLPEGYRLSRHESESCPSYAIVKNKGVKEEPSIKLYPTNS